LKKKNINLKFKFIDEPYHNGRKLTNTNEDLNLLRNFYQDP